MIKDRKYQRRLSYLLEVLEEKGITDRRVLEAIGNVPRHLFVEPALQGRAYEDEALPIGLQQTISQPYTVAYQTVLLDPRPEDRVLEIGTGSGYQAAVLCELGARVFSVERHAPLLERTRALLAEMGYRVVTRVGDGTLGWPAFAPYDRIVVTAGASDVPPALLAQLREPSDTTPGGRLIIPVGDADGQTMTRVDCVGPGAFERHETHGFRFVPLIGRGGGSLR